MLLFLAAMQGFCLTRDLFNLFVWFEVMSVAAFALTGLSLRRSSLAGALNLTVCNSLAATFMLGGIGLLYARTGVLDSAAMGARVARAGHDTVIAVSASSAACFSSRPPSGRSSSAWPTPMPWRRARSR